MRNKLSINLLYFYFMNKNFIKLLGLQVLTLGIVLSVIEFFIDNSFIVIITGLILVGVSFLAKD